MSEHSLKPYEYKDLHTTTLVRVAELLPGKEGDPISCSIHIMDWSHPLEYEAVSYAWGDPNDKAPVICDGKILEVTRSLCSGLIHLRFQDRSRFLWADALCINQSDIPERGHQVSQMRRIYESAKAVLIWIGPDTPEHLAKVTVDSILLISDFICKRLGISISDLDSVSNIYQEVVLKNRDGLPLPNECEFSADAVWKSLIWLYSHAYFTRVWVVQEVSANKERFVHCGLEKVEWNRVDLVAGFIMMEPAFSTKFGFEGTYCWWATTVTELTRQPENWLHMLYLASNYSCMDQRDAIYGLRGLMKFSDGFDCLDPDYSKPILEVYRDSVEAAFLNFQKTDVLLYVAGGETPSWVPRWNQSMLFRNPFRFGKAVPWKPAGETKPIWNIDKRSNILFLSGFAVDSIELVEPYNEKVFGNAMIMSDEGKNELRQIWQRILKTVGDSQSQIPLSTNVLTAVATSFSFGLNENIEHANEHLFAHNFAAYLKIVLDEETYNRYIPPELAKEAEQADGLAFGKPIWDFKYPESSFFVTKNRWMGCAISATRPGDMVCVAFGSTYPSVLRPEGDHFYIRCYAYVHGIMYGEQRNSEARKFEIH